MSAFGEDFREEIAAAYDDLLNCRRGDGLAQARQQGTHALADWVRRRLEYDLRCAFDTGNPGDVDWACARGALALLMLRDASRAMERMFADAYAGPEEERDAKITEIYKAHAMRLKDVVLPPPSFETMLAELGQTGNIISIDVGDTGHTVQIKSWRDTEAEPREFRGATMVAAVSDAHATIFAGRPYEQPSDPVGQS